MNDAKIKKITTIGMLCAVSYVLMFLIRIPVVLFLKYEPKDVVITIGGFLMGPVVSLVISLVVSLLEMITTSETGPIGCIMNIIATCSFSCTAAIIYKYKKTIKGAVLGLILGVVAMVIAMLMWNYLITPLYMGVPRQEVVKLLLPAILPFNILKGGLNATITFLLYKPVVRTLRKTNLIPSGDANSTEKSYVGAMTISALVLITCLLFVLALKGII